MEEFAKLVIKDFGPAGGLAIILLAVSIIANYKLFLRLNEHHDASLKSEVSHAEELSKCRLTCEREKMEFKENLEKRYHEATEVFLLRDNQKREDTKTLFARFESLMGVVTDALSRQTQALQDVQYAIRENRRK